MLAVMMNKKHFLEITYHYKEEEKMNNDISQGILFLLEDFIINEVISNEEMENILSLPTDKYIAFVSNYTLKGRKL